jgi:hypothetical protein
MQASSIEKEEYEKDRFFGWCGRYGYLSWPWLGFRSADDPDRYRSACGFRKG